MFKKFLKFSISSIIGTTCMLAFEAHAQNIQVIHNSPDAPAVNVLINGSTIPGLVGVTYRTASSFLPLSVGVTTVQIAASANGAIVSTDVVTLAGGTEYRAIATGFLNSTVAGQGFRVNFSTANLITSGNDTRMDIYHSSGNAPAVGVVARGVATLVNSFSFADAPTSVSVPSASYIVDINAGDANGATVASYLAPLGSFPSQGIAVIASGSFPSTFGLIAVDNNGGVVVLSTTTGPSKVQVIHNSPNAPSVNVLINGSTVTGLVNVSYRTASSFLTLNSGVTTVQIAAASNNAIVSTDVITLVSGMNYRAIATGFLNSTVSGQGFRVNFSAANLSTSVGNTRMDIYHSSGDAPAVGVVARTVATLVNSFSFADAPTSVSVPSASYNIDINAGNAAGATVASYIAPLSSFTNASIAVVASGSFPSTFGLIAVATNGTVVVLSTTSGPAFVQVIHNSPGAPNVNVLINGSSVTGLVNVPFRAASPFLALNPGVTTVQIAVSASGAIVSTDVITLVSAMNYRAIATGIVGSSISGQAFRVNYSAADLSTSAGNTRMDIYHSSPTAPTVGVVARGVATLVSAFSFADAPTSVSVPSASYTIDINAGNATGSTAASFTAPLGSFSNQSIAVIASGLFPSTFALIAVDINGNVVILPTTTSPITTINSFDKSSEFVVYPNPTSDVFEVETGLNGAYNYQLINSLGTIATTSTSSKIDVSGLSSGIYLLQVIENGAKIASKRIIVK